MRQPTRVKDPRRVGQVFQDEALPEDPENNVIAAENWKSVMTELHEKKLQGREVQFNVPTKLRTSFDSGIQQEYNSDNDEVSNSIHTTLKRLVELSKEQQIYLSHSESWSSIVNSELQQVPEFNSQPCNTQRDIIDSRSRSIDCISVRSSSSNEANNLIEEVIMKNSCSSERTLSRRQVNIDERIKNINFGDLQNSMCDATGGPSACSSKPTEEFVDSSLINSLRMSEKNATKIESKQTSMADSDNSEIVIAIDIGTSYSGFAYAIDNFTSSSVKLLKNPHGSDFKKIPSILLLNSRTEFHSFGYDALEYFLNIEENSNVPHPQWLLFDKFKLQLLNTTEMNRDSKIKAINGISIPALLVYTRVLNHLKCLAMEELTNILRSSVNIDQIRWIISIPAIWSVKGKLFIQEAAFNAGLCRSDTVKHLSIIYECEAAATSCNLTYWNSSMVKPPSVLDSPYFLIINCGGGSLDASVHESIDENYCVTSEIHKPAEIISTSLIVNEEFVKFLSSIFGKKILYLIQLEKPASLIDLIYQFEICKCVPNCTSKSADIYFRNSFLNLYEKICGKQVNNLANEIGKGELMWHKNGTLCLSIETLKKLFEPLSRKIIQFIEQILKNREERKISQVFFTGGLAKSQILQREIRNHFKNIVSVVFDHHEGELAVSRGALQTYRKNSFRYSKMNQSYAIGVIKEFKNDVHPLEKLVLKEGKRWCCDLLDWLVRKDQILQQGEVILKRYTPTTTNQSCIVINIYTVEREESQFVTDDGVHIYGVLRLSTPPTDGITQHEILLQLIFTGDQFVINALDTLTSRCDQIHLDNLSYL